MVSFPDNYRVPLHIRNPVQVDTAAGWTKLRDAEHLDVNDVLIAWARLFAGLFATLCDGYRVDPFVFKERFTEFEESITGDVQLLKWAASSSEQGDVGYDGVARLISSQIEEVFDGEERKGVELTLIFPFIGEGGGALAERTVFFPDTPEQPAAIEVAEWVI